jgi:hypothetical protein
MNSQHGPAWEATVALSHVRLRNCSTAFDHFGSFGTIRYTDAYY